MFGGGFGGQMMQPQVMPSMGNGQAAAPLASMQPMQQMPAAPVNATPETNPSLPVSPTMMSRALGGGMAASLGHAPAPAWQPPAQQMPWQQPQQMPQLGGMAQSEVPPWQRMQGNNWGGGWGGWQPPWAQQWGGFW